MKKRKRSFTGVGGWLTVVMAAWLGWSFPGSAAKQRLGAVKEVKPGPAYVELVCEGGKVRVSTRGSGLLHVVATDDPEFSSLPSFALDPAGPPETAAAWKEEGDRLLFSAGFLTLAVDRKNGRMEFADAAGVFLSEPGEGGIFFDGNTVGCVKVSPADEHYYGFGEKTGPLDKRGKKMTMWNSDAMYGLDTDPLYQSHPVYLALRSGRAYGVFFDNTFRSEFDMGRTLPDRVVFSAGGGEMNYWVMGGPTPKDVLTQYGQLVGRLPLPPLWGIGYHQCRYSYRSAAEVRKIRDNFIRRHIPCDAIYLDIHYMDDFRVFTFDPRRFPDPAGLIGELGKDGIRTVVIVDPGIKIDPNYPPYVQGVEHDYFVRSEDGSFFTAYVWPQAVHFPDFYQPAVREWWGGLLKFYTGLGVAGFWCDMNEPAGWKKELRPLPDLPVPLGVPDWNQMVHGKSPQPLLPHEQVHNVYANLELEGAYEGLKKLRPRTRPLCISRAGYPGLQRRSLIWTGDNTSSWPQLAMCLPMLLNMGLSGLAFVGSDIGGFVGTTTPERYARWIQQGVFYPFCRTHKAIYMHRQEPWSFGRRVEDISREAIKLRYRLLPYTYSLFEESSRNNWPVMRAMLFEFPEDAEVVEVQDQFMWGPFLLVAPVVEQGRNSRSVYFPKGRWYEWPTMKQYEGPGRFEVSAPLNRIPLFIREGAIIPVGPDMQFTGEKPWDPLTVLVVPGAGTSGFDLYEDDGESFEYQEGVFARSSVVCERSAEGVAIRVSGRSGRFVPRREELHFLVFLQKPGAQVEAATLAGRPLSVETVFAPALSALRLKIKDDGRGMVIKIK